MDTVLGENARWGCVYKKVLKERNYSREEIKMKILRLANKWMGLQQETRKRSGHNKSGSNTSLDQSGNDTSFNKSGSNTSLHQSE